MAQYTSPPQVQSGLMSNPLNFLIIRVLLWNLHLVLINLLCRLKFDKKNSSTSWASRRRFSVISPILIQPARRHLWHSFPDCRVQFRARLRFPNFYGVQAGGFWPITAAVFMAVIIVFESITAVFISMFITCGLLIGRRGWFLEKIKL